MDERASVPPCVRSQNCTLHQQGPSPSTSLTCPLTTQRTASTLTFSLPILFQPHWAPHCSSNTQAHFYLRFTPAIPTACDSLTTDFHTAGSLRVFRALLRGSQSHSLDQHNPPHMCPPPDSGSPRQGLGSDSQHRAGPTGGLRQCVEEAARARHSTEVSCLPASTCCSFRLDSPSHPSPILYWLLLNIWARDWQTMVHRPNPTFL